jgi:hypothetical protein
VASCKMAPSGGDYDTREAEQQTGFAYENGARR